MLWAPVAFGLGAAGYLELKVEPSWSLLALVALALSVLAVWSRGWPRWSGLAIPLTLAAFAASGALAGKIRCDRVAAPVMPVERAVHVIDGFVVDVVSPGAAGPRLLVAPVSISRMSPATTPTRIRVSLAEGEVAPPPGSALRLRAMLSAPPPPAAPGAYDFARDAWFNGVGGVGFIVGQIEEAELDPPPWRLRLAMAVNAVRWDLASRIVARLGPDSGGIAAAMVTGHEAWVTPEQTEAMRASGLAHILSISGLHMAIVGGFVFAAVRLAVAAWPWVALRVSGKKIAAVAGLLAVLAYLVISGAPPPALRAAITAGVAFLAILADRQAVSLHGLALAALIILVAQPESAGAPGFQMSFAATAALVALAEAWPRPAREISVPWPIRFAQAAMGWLAISVGASFVAGLATGPFAMQHFNRVAVWGLPANLVVSPLSSFVIMPFLAVGAVLEPLGIGGPFLAIAGWGIDAMTAVARWFASAHGAQQVVASGPPFTLALSFLGIMLLCLWKGRLRWLGIPLACAVALWPRPTPPDLWIAADGATAAVRSGHDAVLLRPDARRFGAELWARRRGLAPVAGKAFACDRVSCRPTSSAPVAVSLSWTRRAPAFEALEPLCMGAEVVVLRGPRPAVLPAACRDAVVLAGEDFVAGGAAELWRRPDGWWIVWAQPGRGARPWVTTADRNAQDPGG
ncbi:ComEC/Rec2 family competence protein [Caulobacter hibisci]|uniref:ComEC/Rec2 family competence protein n=1 Tax=Caulobacter hibisci TaxID=2035993 RepID=A0ABS0SWW7_9CAUL|nr:ComEC/Rec2 family competence protein [Caulobacter hibisci]MBI1683761.1 ComEC/Rec2 family competence protein [Caulobacter hibisci]